MAEFFRDDLSPEPRIPLTKEMLIAARIPSDFWRCELKKIPDKPLLPYKAQLLNYVANMQKNDKEGNGLLLYGPYGSGKSGAACAIAKEAMRRGGRAIFISSLELDATFGKNLDNALREAVLNTHFLVFDDVGAEKGIPWSPTWVETIIKLRNNNRLPTFITTNEKPIEFCSRIKSIASILGGRYQAIQISGIDWRMDPPKD